MAKVYGLYNRTRKERYYGITTRQNVKRMKEHASGQANALKHWNFSEDDIEVRIVARGLSQENAVARVYELELRKSRAGWKTIQTGEL